jgi:hypothetical protein
MRFLGNYRKRDKDNLLLAAVATGRKVEWKNEVEPPHESIKYKEFYGSLWSTDFAADMSDFWKEFERLTNGRREREDTTAR